MCVWRLLLTVNLKTPVLKVSARARERRRWRCFWLIPRVSIYIIPSTMGSWELVWLEPIWSMQTHWDPCKIVSISEDPDQQNKETNLLVPGINIRITISDNIYCGNYVIMMFHTTPQHLFARRRANWGSFVVFCKIGRSFLDGLVTCETVRHMCSSSFAGSWVEWQLSRPNWSGRPVRVERRSTRKLCGQRGSPWITC